MYFMKNKFLVSSQGRPQMLKPFEESHIWIDERNHGPKFIDECLLRRVSVALGAIRSCLKGGGIGRKRVVLGQGY